MISSPPEYNIEERSNKDSVSVEDLMAFLEIDSQDEQTRSLLIGRLQAAVDMVGSYTQLSITERTMSVFFRQMDGVRPIKFGPVLETGISMITGGFDGVATSTSTPTPDQVYGYPRPRLRGCYRAGVKVVYRAGYTGTTIPHGLREAVLVCASELYCELTGFKPSGNMAFNWRVLANPYRDFR